MQNRKGNRLMDYFFGVVDERYQRSLYINHRLKTMSKDEMKFALQKFRLIPIEDYFDARTIKNEENNETICGFIRYFDHYLIEHSGGKKTKLIKIGKDLTGKEFHNFSMRLIRAEIIKAYFSQF